MRRLLRRVALTAWVCAAVSLSVGAEAQGANPAGYGGAPAMMVAPQVAAPDFRGMTLQEAQAANVIVPANGTQAKAVQQKIFSALNTTGPADGVVDSQTPAAGTKVYPGRVAATLTMKAAQVMVPMLKGMSGEEARSRLAQSSLVLGQITGDATQRIAMQTPAAGASVSAQTVVNVVMEVPAGGAGVSGPKEPEVVEVTVPNVLKLRESAAMTQLAAAGLGKAIVLGPADGVVVKQTPVAGTRVAEGSRVRLAMGLQKNDILVVTQKSMVWGWYAAGGVVLLGAIGAFIAARRPPTPPEPPKPIPMSAVVATMVAKANVATAKVKLKNDPALRWSVQLRDKAAVGVATLKGEIEGKR